MEELTGQLIRPALSADFKEKTVLAFFDTTLPNFEKNKGKLDLDSPHIGYLNKLKGIGFAFHAAVLVSPTTGLPLGMGACEFQVRPLGQESTHYKSRPPEDRESTKWFHCLERTRAVLAPDCHLIAVCDREADIYDFINQAKRLPNTDVIIRVARDRIVWNDEQKTHLMDVVQMLPINGSYTIQLREQSGRPAREARLVVRCGQVNLARPQAKAASKHLDAQQPLYLITVREEGHPAGLDWKLYTTLPVNNLTDALKIVDYYKERWIIEDVFRIMKTQGLELESSQMESGEALQRLTVVALATAIKILAFRQGRDHQEPGSIHIYFSAFQQNILKLLLPKVQGRRGKQINPYPPDTLAWAVWIIARLGGWNPGNAKRPPGVIALHRGWLHFIERVAGAELVLDSLKSQDSPFLFSYIP
jgi:hypothetical protein